MERRVDSSGPEHGLARFAVGPGTIDLLNFAVNLYQHHEDPARAALLETCAAREVSAVAMRPAYGGGQWRRK